jgi:hypothetical protein
MASRGSDHTAATNKEIEISSQFLVQHLGISFLFLFFS